MRVLIVEDEPLAAERLEALLKKADPEVEIAGICDSVKQSVSWFQQHDPPDLIFLDIQLGDGLSFEIFDQVVVDSPVIFTTAFDAYAIEAFKLNSIAYLLKPVKMEELVAALFKFRSSPYFAIGSGASQHRAVEKVQQLLTRAYKKRFLVKTGVHYRSIPVEEILYCCSLEKATFATLVTGKTYLFDYTLEQLETLLDPAVFFRINRKYIISVAAISDMITYSNSRMKLVIKNCNDQDVFISRDRMQDFRSWLDQ
jgi:two-component system, LytTR family, response regulator